jgi:seryl-tRNA synthetase
MIDLEELRKNPALYQEACRKKRIKFDVEEFLKLDALRRETIKQSESYRAEQNAASKLVPTLKGDEKNTALTRLKELSSLVKDSTARLKEIEEEWEKMQLRIPAPPLESVPEGKDDSENVEVSRWGEPRKFSFEVKSHAELGEKLGILDIERGVKIAGSRSYFLKADGARLQNALLQYACDFITERGYTLMDPPHIVHYRAMTGTGYFPGGEEMAYHLDARDEDFYLIGTSEVSVASYHCDEILSHEELPKRYSGYSPCYRREAGTYGKDTHGLYRVHQFYKVEQVVVCEESDETSSSFHQELLKNSEELLQSLGLAYRVVAVCTGDMGQGQVFKHDIETWMPSRGHYGETHSCSTLHSFQARRLNLRYRDKTGKVRFCHTLNNTLAASPRILIPIIENYQNADGTVTIPEVLVPYMRGQKVIEHRTT